MAKKQPGLRNQGQHQQNVMDSGRGGPGRGGRMVQGRGGRGRIVHGGRGGRGQIQQQQIMYLHHLQDHLLLHIFNMLGDQGRINAFRALGWSTQRYVNRRNNLRKQMEMKEMREKEMSERKEWRDGLFKNVLQAGLNKDGASVEGGDEVEGGVVPMETGEEKKEADGKNAPPTEEMAKVSFSEDTKEGKKEKPEVLPHLGMRVDPITLLCRLNTRRLYGRLKYYNKLKKDRDAEEERFKADALARGVTLPEPSIIEMYDRDLKEQLLRDRIYPKNMTVMQMAQKEWNELIEIANYRNKNGHSLPFEPIPPKHELLLFQKCPRAVAVLASYPRSGNSLMRTLYEHTTLRVTGSDMQGGLAKHDLVGEMAVGAGMVQFVKTHYPERMGSSAFQCSRAVLLVRNPFDCIESYFHLMMTGEHTKSMSDENREKAMKYFDEYAVKEAQVWTKFHEFWLNQDIPLLLIRYEDLYRQTDQVMERTLQFVLEVKRMGTFFTERVDRCIREQQKIESLGSYKPRSAGIGKSLKKYKAEVIERMKTPALVEVMKRLGYSYMLENPVEKWTDMPPLPNYAQELMTAHAFVGENQNVIVLNNNAQIISRSQELHTPFAQIKRDIGIVDDNCDCDECVKRRQLVGGSEKQEEKKEEVGDDTKKDQGEGAD